jgi:hypothetical protein
MITVQVFSQNSGKPEESKRVAIGKNDFWAGGVTKELYTDSDGEAHFDTAPAKDGKIFVNGRTVYEGRIEGRIVVYI